FEDRSLATRHITMASASVITGPWTVESSPVVSDGISLVGQSPCLFQDGSFWYIYYAPTGNSDMNVVKSSTINGPYSSSGISNPILTRGGAGTWDENRILEPFVFKEGSTYYMFYMGESV